MSIAVSLSPNGQTRLDADAPPTKVVVGTTDGVVVVERAKTGAPWKVAAHQLRDKHVSSLLVDDKSGEILAGIHHGGIYFSGDHGTSWERRTNGLGHEHVYSLMSTKRNGRNVVYAGTEPVSLYRSENNGKDWQELPTISQVPGTDKWDFPAPPHVAHTKSLAIDPRNPDIIYAAIEQGALLRTTDAGKSWLELDSYYDETEPVYRDVHRIVMVQSNPDEMYMTSGMGLYHSLDAGRNWKKLTGRDFDIGYPDHFIVSPLDPKVVYMSGARHNPGTWRQSHHANGNVYRSDDQGRSWKPANRGLPQSWRANIEAMSLVAYPGGFTMFAGSTDGDVYCSEDQGESWSQIAAGLSPISKGNHSRALQQPAA
jgi:photosystem II stability/assembly factor-like uncharacterized protein